MINEYDDVVLSRRRKETVWEMLPKSLKILNDLVVIVCEAKGRKQNDAAVQGQDPLRRRECFVNDAIRSCFDAAFRS